jgi:hypothetical protein
MPNNDELHPLSTTTLERALTALGQVLAARDLAYEIVVVGGSGLLLLGVISRPTRDVDVIALVSNGEIVKAQPLPDDLLQAVRDVGEVLDVGSNWLNSAPADLIDLGLPDGFAERTVPRAFGPLTLRVAGRIDQIFFKLDAAVDQGPSSKHFQDLQALRPSEEALLQGARWVVTHDPSPAFRADLVSALSALGLRDAESRI